MNESNYNQSDTACFCGSGRRFEDCHLGREDEAPLHPKALSNLVRKASQLKTCLHPDQTRCDNRIVASHSLQKAGPISKLVDSARHVRTFHPVEYEKDGSRKVHHRGWREASTFSGFCTTHEAELFGALESRPFVGDSEQCFLLGYRAICHELYTKSSVAKAAPIVSAHVDKGLPIEHQITSQARLATFNMGLEKGLDDIVPLKARYDAAVLSGDYTSFNYVAIFFDGDLSVAATSIVHADFDVDGNRLQRLADLSKLVEGVAFGVIDTSVGGAFVFSWLPEHTAATVFVRSILKKKHSSIPGYLVQFIFGFVENTYFAESWWLSLKPKDRERLTFLASLPSGYENPFSYSGRRYVNWQITGINHQIT